MVRFMELGTRIFHSLCLHCVDGLAGVVGGAWVVSQVDEAEGGDGDELVGVDLAGVVGAWVILQVDDEAEGGDGDELVGVGLHCVGSIVVSNSTLVSRLDPCKPLVSTMDAATPHAGKGRRSARAGKGRGKARAGQGKGGPAGKAAGKAGVQGVAAGERVGGASGKRHQVVYAYPSVPGDTTAGTDVLFSGYWDNNICVFSVYHTPAPVSCWWTTHPRAWLFMGKATWSENTSDWTGTPVWGYAGVLLRRRWGV